LKLIYSFVLTDKPGSGLVPCPPPACSRSPGEKAEGIKMVRGGNIKETFLYQRKGENAVPQVFAVATFNAMHRSLTTADPCKCRHIRAAGLFSSKLDHNLKN